MSKYLHLLGLLIAVVLTCVLTTISVEGMVDGTVTVSDGIMSFSFMILGLLALVIHVLGKFDVSLKADD